jgi:hypothetical protein
VIAVAATVLEVWQWNRECAFIQEGLAMSLGVFTQKNSERHPRTGFFIGAKPQPTKPHQTKKFNGSKTVSLWDIATADILLFRRGRLELVDL